MNSMPSNTPSPTPISDCRVWPRRMARSPHHTATLLSSSTSVFGAASSSDGRPAGIQPGSSCTA